MNLIQNHEPIQMLAQIQLGLGKLRPVSFGFQIEIESIAELLHLHGQSRLPCLPRPEQRNRRKHRQVIQKRSKFNPRNHPCNYRIILPDLQGLLFWSNKGGDEQDTGQDKHDYE